MGPRHERIGPLLHGVDRPSTATYPAGAVLADRTLDVHALVWVVRGAVEVHAGDGVRSGGSAAPRRRLGPGDVLVVPPGVAHGFRWGTPDGDAGCVHGYLHLDLAGAAPAVPALTVAGPGEPLAGLCAYLTWLGVHEPPGWEAPAARAATLVVDLVVHGPLPGGAPAGGVPSAVPGALLAELRERWGAGPPLPAAGVADLAGALHVSPTHLTRSVRRVWGRPLSVLLEQLRLTRVELLLTGTSSTVATIARQCGYADAFHCSRRFAAAHGVPPGRWRSGVSRPSLLDDPVVREVAAAVWG